MNTIYICSPDSMEWEDFMRMSKEALDTHEDIESYSLGLFALKWNQEEYYPTGTWIRFI